MEELKDEIAAAKESGTYGKGIIPSDEGYIEELSEATQEFIAERPVVWEAKSKAHIDFLSSTEDEVLASGGRGSGKALSYDSLVLTPDGFKPMWAIQENSLVMSVKNTPSRVIKVIEMGEKTIYRLVLMNDAYVDCTSDHLWSVRVYSAKKYDEVTVNTRKLIKLLNKDTEIYVPTFCPQDNSLKYIKLECIFSLPEKKLAKCIAIDHPSKLFICQDYIVTHNSDALIVDPLPMCDKKKFRGLLLRRTMKELRELISRAKDLYPQVYPGVQWKKQESIFEFPSGAVIEFGYCQSTDDLEQYRGREFTWVGIDELTQFESEEVIEKLRASMRSTDPTIPIYIRACVDEGDVLTTKGWKPIQDVIVGDTVYSVDSFGNALEKKVYSVSSYDIDEDLVRVKKKNLYMSMTQDHRVCYTPHQTRRVEISRWNEYEGKSIQVLRAPIHYQNTGYKGYTFNGMEVNDWLAFLGIFLAEGHTVSTVRRSNYTIGIAQHKKQNLEAIGYLCDKTGLNWCYTKSGEFKFNNKELYTYLRQFGQSHDKHIPREILETGSREELKLILDWLIIGDGHWQSDTSCDYVTVSRQLADDVSEICTKLGYKVKVSRTVLDNPNHRDRYDIHFVVPKVPTTLVEPKRQDKTDTFLEPFKGKVYCVSVEDTENFIIRQKGTVWVSGNTTNSTGIGRRWVKERFIDLGPPGKTLVLNYDTPLGPMKITRKWIHSTVFDNPDLIKHNPQYVAYLASLTGVLRDQWFHGSWDAAEGNAFPEFRREKHVVAPFEIPSSWMRFRACDWGYGRGLAVVLWFAIDPSDLTTYVYREFVANGDIPYTEKLNSVQFAKRVMEIESKEKVRYGVIDGKTVARKNGETGPTIEMQMKQVGLSWKHADQSKGSRVSGKMLVHQYLTEDQFTGKPKLQIFNTCRELIKELSDIPIDDNNPEDVNTDVADHAYDALRYGLTSRPERMMLSSEFHPNKPTLTSTPMVLDTYGI